MSTRTDYPTSFFTPEVFFTNSGISWQLSLPLHILEKKRKARKVTVAEAAAAIDVQELNAFLSNVTVRVTEMEKEMQEGTPIVRMENVMDFR